MNVPTQLLDLLWDFCRAALDKKCLQRIWNEICNLKICLTLPMQPILLQPGPPGSFFCMNEWACLWQKLETSWILKKKSSLYLVANGRIFLGILAPFSTGLTDFSLDICEVLRILLSVEGAGASLLSGLSVCDWQRNYLAQWLPWTPALVCGLLRNCLTNGSWDSCISLHQWTANPIINVLSRVLY